MTRPNDTDKAWRILYADGDTSVSVRVLADAIAHRDQHYPDAEIVAYDTDNPYLLWPHDMREPEPDERLWGVQWFTGAVEAERTLAKAEEWVAKDPAPCAVVWWDGHIWRPVIPDGATTPDEPSIEDDIATMLNYVDPSDGDITEAMERIARRLREATS